jgi:hypothetical protein
VGEVTVGFQQQAAGTVQTGDLTVMSGPALGDSGRISYDGGTTFFTKNNGGKSILEFVLDEGGVTPIEVDDELRIGRDNHTSWFVGDPNPQLYGFMRLKLMAPTTAGSGAVGSGNELVLVRADRVTSTITFGTEEVVSQLEEGRFMDPDRDLPGVFPHRPMLEGGTVISDYAGATYTWTINYLETLSGADDNEISDTIVLSNLLITGTPGDLLEDGAIGAEDRNALIGAIASPPATIRQLLGQAQHLFDLNADDVIDNLDLVAYDTYFSLDDVLPGDYNDDGTVDGADYTVWRNNRGGSDSALNGNGPGTGTVDDDDYTYWRRHYGTGDGGGGGIGTAVPEPSSVFLAILAAAAVFGFGRRDRAAA